MNTCPVVRTIWITKQGKFVVSIGNARVSAPDIRDMAAVAAEVLTKSGHEGKVYTLTGSQTLTQTERADGLATAVGHRILFINTLI